MYRHEERRHEAAVLTRIGAAKLARGELREARRMLSRSLALDPRRSDTLAKLALVCWRLRRVREAERIYRAWARASPVDPEALAHLGLFLSCEGRSGAGTERLLRAALALAPDLRFARYALGAHLARAGRSREAHAHLLIAAREGFGAAQNALACLYLRADDDCAVHRARPWLELAARAGDPEALFNLGVSYDFGAGVARDPQRAAELYAGAAALDLPAAQYNLAVLLREGSGVCRDERQAAYWLGRAAAAGDVGAQLAFACACRDGVGIERDPDRALRWFGRAARQGHAHARYVLALELLLGGDEARRGASPALRWLSREARAGEPEAQNALALVYFHGRGVSRDPHRAFWWFRCAAGRGHESAQLCLGMAYLLGDGPVTDPVQGVRWLTRAAESGHPGAQRRLGVCFARGLGVRADPTQAYMWTVLACEGGDPHAWRLRRLLARRVSPRQRSAARKRADAWIGAHPASARPSARRAATCEEPFEAALRSGLGPRRRAPSSLGIGALRE